MTKTIDSTKILYKMVNKYKPANQPSYVTTTEFKIDIKLQKPKSEFIPDELPPQVK